MSPRNRGRHTLTAKTCGKHSIRKSSNEDQYKSGVSKDTHKKVASLLCHFGVLLACVAVILFVFSFYRVDTMNMYPSFQMGDLLIGQRVIQPGFGDVVVYSSNGKKCVGRVAACPNEKVDFSDGLIFVNGSPHPCDAARSTEGLYLGSCEYFIVSDSEEETTEDSLSQGPISQDDIEATCFWLFRCRTL